jgi:hypothetical protein
MIWGLILSGCINVYLLLYVKWLLSSLTLLSDNADSMKGLFTEFKEHVEQIHESEMFYGDTTLQNLIKHSKLVLEELEKYEDFINYVEETTTEAEAEDRE